MDASRLSRRRFIKSTALLAAAPLILPGRVWSAESAPSKRLTLGCIGTGKQMRFHLGNFVQRNDLQVLAVCDVDTTRREAAKKLVDDAYSAANNASYRACDAYVDFREVLARDDIDAVVIATPDHWHAIIAIAAVNARKDVYCEKPLTYSVHEAVELVKAVRKNNRVLQTGSQQRSAREFRVAAELVRNGVLGRINSVHVSFGPPARNYAATAEPVQAGLDWDFWCGPGPLVPYSSYLCPPGIEYDWPQWRATWEFGGGMITDWGAHHIDIAQWALGMDDSGPIEVRAPENWETADRGAQLVYPGNIELTHVRGKGVSFYGTDGEVHVHRRRFELIMGGKTVHRFWDRETDSGTSVEREVELTHREFLADAKVQLPVSRDHIQNFVDAVRERNRPICDVEIGARSVIACHVMNFAYHYGANAKWDPQKHQFARGGNAKWLRRENYRAGWKV